MPPLKAPRSALVEFDVSPFPYEGRAAHRQAFLRCHGRGRPARPQLGARGVLWEDVTYCDAGRCCSCPRASTCAGPA